MIIIGTTISLVLTIGTSVMLERRERASDRRLSALMVMGLHIPGPSSLILPTN